MKRRLNPQNSRPYRRDAFNAQRVEGLLMMADAPCPAAVIASWNADQLEAAGDWALREHLRASDNKTVRRKPKPDHVANNQERIAMGPDTGTVMDLVAGRKRY